MVKLPLQRFRAIIVPHTEFQQLDESVEARKATYRDLFKHQLSENSITNIRNAINKAWALGSDSLKQRIQDQLGRYVEPKGRGGDRKSKNYQDTLFKI
jgi:putative transposase